VDERDVHAAPVSDVIRRLTRPELDTMRPAPELRLDRVFGVTTFELG
jgi:hypothetical protein